MTCAHPSAGEAIGSINKLSGPQTGTEVLACALGFRAPRQWEKSALAQYIVQIVIPRNGSVLERGCSAGNTGNVKYEICCDC
jgi:hypothetical protein